MRRWHDVVRRPAAIVLLAALAIAVAAGLPAAAARRGVTGTVRVSGAWALYPVMVRWATEFQKVNPRVRIDVIAGGAGKGAADALGGRADIGMVSRDIHPDEVKKGAWYVPVVKDAVLPTANVANPAKADLLARGLTQAQFRALWVDGKRMTWGDLVGKPQLKEPVRVYTRSDACGAAETWAKYLGAAQDDLRDVAVYGDPGLADAVKHDKAGAGYNNLNYVYDARTGRPAAGLMLIPIDIDGNGSIDAAERFYGTRKDAARAIAEGRYPSPPARDLNLLTKGKPTGATAAFIRWILTDGQRFVEPEGYVRLPAAELKSAVDKLR
jgi:phosphate transport system substrate-binding protein